MRLQRQYGITSAQYDAIAELQEGVCAVCGAAPKPGAYLNVDHDHKTGLVRGLLCWSCNRRVVADHRDPKLLQSAANYLEYPPAPFAIGFVYGRTGRVTNKRRKTKKKKETKAGF